MNNPVCISDIHRGVAEKLHADLLKLHGDIFWKALKRVESSLETLHALERKHVDYRAEARRRIELFEALRSKLEGIGREAGTIRSDLIRVDGCDASCRGSAGEQP